MVNTDEGPGNWNKVQAMPRKAFSVLLFAALISFVALKPASGQGETTSAIVGRVSDESGAPVPGTGVTVTNKETGLKRFAKSDESGRFNFPQLQPGTYSVKVEAAGFEPQQNDKVSAALGQKQSVEFTLKVSRAMESIEVRSEAAILNPENANTSTTLNARALEDVPNPGGDLTYPLQFAT
jgi:hypothetical protein